MLFIFFSSRKNFSTTNAIVSVFFCFFFSRLFMKILKFSKTVHPIFIKCCTVILHPKGPLHARRHQNRGWGVRNIAKISPKMAKRSHFSAFFDFLKNSPYDSNEIFYSHSTPQYGPTCAIPIKWYDWDWSESEGKRPKPTPLPHMRLWVYLMFCGFLLPIYGKKQIE